MTCKKCIFFGKYSKSHLLYVKKVKKLLDNNAKFELKIAQFNVFQGKKSKSHLLKIQKVKKKNSIIRRKITEIYLKKLLKTHSLSALKFEKVTDNKAFQTNFHIFKTGEISLKVTKTLKKRKKV